MKEKQYTLGFYLSRAANAMSVHLNGYLKQAGIDLPYSQYVILKHLYEEDGMSQQELADLVFKDTAAVKRTLDILEKKGLVERVPVSQRKNSVRITDAGRELMPQVMECLENSRKIVMSGINREEEALLRSILERLYRNTQ